VVSRSHGGERLRRSGPSTHLSESPPQELAPATRLDDKPRRLPRFHRARPSTALDERRRSPGVFGWKLHHVRQASAMPAGQNLLRFPRNAPGRDPEPAEARGLCPPRKDVVALCLPSHAQEPSARCARYRCALCTPPPARCSSWHSTSASPAGECWPSSRGRPHAGVRETKSGRLLALRTQSGDRRHTWCNGAENARRTSGPNNIGANARRRSRFGYTASASPGQGGVPSPPNDPPRAPRTRRAGARCSGRRPW
jgi:hypothetical protein